MMSDDSNVARRGEDQGAVPLLVCETRSGGKIYTARVEGSAAARKVVRGRERRPLVEAVILRSFVLPSHLNALQCV